MEVDIAGNARIVALDGLCVAYGSNAPEAMFEFIQRGFWVNGVSTLGDYLRSGAQFTLEGRAEKIRCPTLLTSADRDPLASGARSLYEALTCPKTIIHFTVAEGAGEHCEEMNRLLLNRRVFDWLDGSSRRDSAPESMRAT